MPSIAEIEHDLLDGKVSSRQLTEDCFARIEQPDGEGSRTFIRVFKAAALATASSVDSIRATGLQSLPLAGIPISIKDLFDVKGVTTLAGSTALSDGAPAKRDAVAVARLRAAGAIIVGTTNMTEFAFSGLGLNPHYGTPLNPWDRKAGQIPGGSSSGSAVSVTDGMSIAAIGSDTAGSARIPAALCGIVGFKPTARRIPLDGVVPLAPTLDSVGVLASTVECCARIDAVLASGGAEQLDPSDSTYPRLAIPKTLVFDGIDGEVANAFSRAISWLSAAGCRITDVELSELAELPVLNSKGGFVVPEAYAWHHDLLAKKRDSYDPIIANRLSAGASITAKDYLDLCRGRADLSRRMGAITRNYDAILMPTAVLPAPRIADLNTETSWLETNRMILRNTAIANFFDRCAISLPCHRPGDAPVGLMVMGETMSDRRMLEIACTVEAVLNAKRHA